MIKIILVIFLVTAVFNPSMVYADSWRCGTRLVSLGHLTREVEDLCGLPFYVDVFQLENVVKTFKKISKSLADVVERTQGEIDGKDRDFEHGYDFINEHSKFINIEKWTYNLSPHSFIRVLTFKNDRLISIEEGSYGFNKTDINFSIKLGDSKAIVVMKYGMTEDIQKDVSYIVDVTRRKDGDYLYVEKYSRPIVEEKWIYDLGPDRYLKQLTFRNDILVRIKSLKTKGRGKVVSHNE